jgi:hypothetical protein
MIRRKLAEVPVERGNWVSFAIICGYIGYVIGWVTQPTCAMWVFA